MGLGETDGSWWALDDADTSFQLGPVHALGELSKDSVLLEGVNCILPFGRRKILYVRDAIELGREQASLDSVPN